ncbi:hypothetical protein HDF26_001743 [Pedobacter cryoconitis]|uniref:hypothetical protein n=1 Tax=Pedobacter cryoconitis TaxID=188932 RepID=UPI001609BAB7|nr:hypothetical protein [Pedobacter cryoconitis]MBB6271316.1 hypothetical protein [Pedobacter cryoconitis]
MKALILLILSIYTIPVNRDLPATAELRSLYYQAASSKTAADELQKLLLMVDGNSRQLLICYKGASEMIQAKYVLSPFTKFRKFKKGKYFIESAIASEPENLEMRFLRYTIQTNLPSFLGYNNWITADKKMLLERIDNIHDKHLKQLVINYLMTSKYTTDKERNNIRK